MFTFLLTEVEKSSDSSSTLPPIETEQDAEDKKMKKQKKEKKGN